MFVKYTNLDHNPERVQGLSIKYLLFKCGAAGYAVLWRVEELLLLIGSENKEKLIGLISQDFYEDKSKVESILDILIKERILRLKNNIVSSENITNQRKKISRISKQKSEAGKKSRELARVKPTSKPTSKPTGKKKPKKSTPNRKPFKPPAAEEVTSYAKENGYLVDGEAFVKYYEAGDWHDARGHKMLNWKQKCRAVWFREKTTPDDNARNAWFPKEKD